MEADWEPTIPRLNIHQKPSLKCLPTKRKRWKGHRSSKVRQIEVEHKFEQGEHIVKSEQRVEQENKLTHMYQNEVEESVSQLAKLCIENKLTHKFEEEMNSAEQEVEHENRLTYICQNEVDESVSQLAKLCIENKLTHKFEDEINSAVNQLGNMTINTRYDEPQNILHNDREMEVLKYMENLKI